MNTQLNARLWTDKAFSAFARATEYRARAGEAEIQAARVGGNWEEAGAGLRQIADDWEREAVFAIREANTALG